MHQQHWINMMGFSACTDIDELDTNVESMRSACERCGARVISPCYILIRRAKRVEHYCLPASSMSPA